MDQTACGKPHQKSRIKLLAEFGKAKPGTIVDADICSMCGVSVAARELGYDDAGSWMIPSKLAVAVEREAHPITHGSEPTLRLNRTKTSLPGHMVDFARSVRYQQAS